jgi:hypothetical protein
MLRRGVPTIGRAGGRQRRDALERSRITGVSLE